MRPKANHSALRPIFIMGLGNPGLHYEGTRHNVGYRVVDLIAKDAQTPLRRPLFSRFYYSDIPGNRDCRPLMLLRWSGYMNHSGSLIPLLRNKYSVEVPEFLVVVDNMDLSPGQCRLRGQGGDAGHNGLKSLIAAFGSRSFKRLYIGVGRPKGGMSVIDHVLGRPGIKEEGEIESGCHRAADAIERLRTDSFERVAEVLNRVDS